MYQLSQKDAYANTNSHKSCYTYNTRSSIISVPDNKIAVINGLRDYIVVDTDDILMICPREEEQHIREYIDEVRFTLGDKVRIKVSKTNLEQKLIDYTLIWDPAWNKAASRKGAVRKRK